MSILNWLDANAGENKATVIEANGLTRVYLLKMELKFCLTEHFSYFILTNNIYALHLLFNIH